MIVVEYFSRSISRWVVAAICRDEAAVEQYRRRKALYDRKMVLRIAKDAQLCKLRLKDGEPFREVIPV